MDARAVRVAGHFGEFLQGRLGAEGPVALVTVPCPVLGAVARWDGGGDACSVPGDVRRRFIAALAIEDRPEVRIAAEMPLGAGAGASTASLIALARALGADEARLAAACLAAEGAVDPLMLPHPAEALWSSREARIVEMSPPPPVMEIVGGFFGPPERTEASDDRFPDISDLVAGWRKACGAGDLHAVAALASASARRTMSMRGPADDPTGDIASALGALGWVRAHTGSARGLIFAPGTAPKGAAAVLAEAGMATPLRFRTP